jgi:hypothetical protein
VPLGQTYDLGELRKRLETQMLIHASKYEPLNLDRLPSLESTPERSYDDHESEEDEDADSKA